MAAAEAVPAALFALPERLARANIFFGVTAGLSLDARFGARSRLENMILPFPHGTTPTGVSSARERCPV